MGTAALGQGTACGADAGHEQEAQLLGLTAAVAQSLGESRVSQG